MTEGGGDCLFHQKRCALQADCPDLVICGLSCNNFTDLRADHRSLPAQDHDDVSMLLSFVDYLKVRRHLGGILEEVVGFDRPMNPRYWRPTPRAPDMPESWLRWLVDIHRRDMN